MDPEPMKITVVPPPPVTPDPNAAILAAMVSEVAKAMTEPERVKAETALEQARLQVGFGTRALYIAGALLFLILAAAIWVFAQGDRDLLRQAIAGVFGFLGGMGFSRFMQGAK